jgi:hypothetical protein
MTRRIRPFWRSPRRRDPRDNQNPPQERLRNVTSTDTVDHTELTEADSGIITSYTNAISEYVDTMTRASRVSSFSAGISAGAQARALHLWWDALTILADRLTPGDPAAARFLDDQRVRWFRARETALWCAVDYCRADGIIGEPTIPRPEDHRTGVVGNGYGYVGYVGISERLTRLAPVDIRLRVATDGSVAILRPDAEADAAEARLQRR